MGEEGGRKGGRDGGGGRRRRHRILSCSYLWMCEIVVPISQSPQHSR